MSTKPYIIMGSFNPLSLDFISEILKIKRIEPDSKYSKDVLLNALSANVFIADIKAPLRSFVAPVSF